MSISTSRFIVIAVAITAAAVYPTHFGIAKSVGSGVTPSAVIPPKTKPAPA